MPDLRIFPDAEEGTMFSDVGSREGLTECSNVGVGGLSHGTVSGKPTVIIRATTPEGQVVVMQTTLALFLSAADALVAKHGDPRQ
jgi:hypothetical protein